MAKIIQTPARNITVCGDRPNASTFFPPPPPIVTEYALAFDGVNDYLQSNTSFVQWEFTQPFTFYAKFRNIDWTQNSANTIFSSIANIVFGGRGIAIGGFSSSNRFFVLLRNTFPSNEYSVSWQRSTLPSTGEIHITYNGTVNNITSVNLYVNGVLYTTGKILATGGLSSTITGTDTAFIGRSRTDFFAPLTPNSQLEEVSLVDYEKNPTEINADISAGTQLAGTGAFLFQLPTTYKENGTGNIATLDSAVPIPELAQNLDMSYFGYPNPLVLGTNLIEI